MKDKKTLLRYIIILIYCAIGLTTLLALPVMAIDGTIRFRCLPKLLLLAIYISNVILYLISGTIAWLINGRNKQGNSKFMILLTWFIYYILFCFVAYCSDTYKSWWPLAVIGCFIASFLPQIVLIPFINKWLDKQRSTTL